MNMVCVVVVVVEGSSAGVGDPSTSEEDNVDVDTAGEDCGVWGVSEEFVLGSGD